VERQAQRRHGVAVVRVEVRDGGEAELLIELLEVSRDREQDTLLGRTRTVTGACQILQDWLLAVCAAAPGDHTHGRNGNDGGS
jgi:hypothetical protein